MKQGKKKQVSYLLHKYNNVVDLDAAHGAEGAD